MSTENASNPVIYFHSSHWGDHFLNIIPHDEATKVEKMQEVEQLKGAVKKELVATVDKPEEQLSLVDAIERLGVGYHFEKEIDEILEQMYQSFKDQCVKDDLYHVSTRFRILRQHGFRVPCDVFQKFKDESRDVFKCCILEDIRGMLSLYEASHVRIHGDDILDEAFAFTSANLKSVAEKLFSPLAEQVTHALRQPLHKGMVRLESKHYISFYEQDASHNKTLLKLAKVDFNLLQSLHQQELREITGWWRELYAKVPFVRDRLVEGYFWTLACYYEAEYSTARKMFIKLFMLVQVLDDTFDAYGNFDILKLLLEAVNRWDYSCVAELPQYFSTIYQVLLETVDEDEKELTKEGRAYGVHYLKTQMKRNCEAWFKEAIWRHNKHIPSYDEYMKVANVSIGYPLGFVISFLGMGQKATEQGYEWVCQETVPKFIEASQAILRLMNDVGSTEFEQERDHVASSLQCYMKENEMFDKEQVCQAIEKKVEDAWKDLNEGMLRPYSIAKPLLDRILQLTRVDDVFYKGRKDGYTFVNQVMIDNIAQVLVHPIMI